MTRDEAAGPAGALRVEPDAEGAPPTTPPSAAADANGPAWQPEIDSLVPPAGVGRRGFLAGSIGGLGVGFAAAVMPTGPLLAQVIRTDTTGLTAGWVKVPSGGAELPAYRAQPAGGTALATILVVHEVFGAHEYIQDVARRFAKLGYQAIAPELFFRQGDAKRYSTVAELFENIVSKVPDAQVMADLDACLRWSAANGGDGKRIGITGFCWGGRIVWLYAAHQPALKAGVAWYGRLTGPEDAMTPTQPYAAAATLKAPVLGLYGGADTGIPQSTVDEMELRLSTGSPAAEASRIVVFPDAPHAFHADYRPSYRQAAADEGWRLALAWFADHGVGR